MGLSLLSSPRTLLSSPRTLLSSPRKRGSIQIDPRFRGNDKNAREIGFLKSFILLIIFLSLTSCGFHLRGNLDLPPPFHQIYLKSKDPYGELANNLREYFRMSGLHLTDTPQNAETVFVVISETTNQQLLGISGTQQTRQYNLILTVTFTIENPDGKVLVPPQTLIQTRTLTIQGDQILAGSNEANMLYKQMRLSIVYDIMSRLASKDIATLLLPNAT